MTAKVYAGVNAKRLDSLVGDMADDLAGLFHSPVEVTIKGTKKLLFFSCLGLKGDWPALVKLGKLQRHFGRTITSAGAESTRAFVTFVGPDKMGFRTTTSITIPCLNPDVWWNRLGVHLGH